jgi:hypothetical protein
VKDSSPDGTGVPDVFVGTMTVVEDGISIQSSRFRDVSVDDVGCRLGSNGPALAEDVNFKLSAVGISVARGCIEQ